MASATLIALVIAIALVFILGIDGPATTPTDLPPTSQPATPPPATGSTGTGGSVPPDTPPVSSSNTPPPQLPPGTPGTPAVPGAAPAPPATPSWLSSLRDQGLDLGGDEKGALAQIIQNMRAMREIQPLTPYLSAYARSAPQFHAWLQTQQQQQAPAPGANDPWHKEFWNPPEFNQSWLEQYVVTNDKGERGWKPDTPPDVIAKFDAYQSYNRDAMVRMARNPFEFFGGAMEKVATAKAQEIVRQVLSQQREVQQNSQFINQNGGWLYEQNPDGSRKMDNVFVPSEGRWVQTPALSEWGHKFRGYVQQIASEQARHGISDVDAQRRYATSMVERDYAMALYQGKVKVVPANPTGAATPPATPPNPQQAGNEDFLRRNNPSQVPPTIPPTNGNTRFQDPPLPANASELSASLMQALKGAGYN